jgi:hypothetical protein
VLQPPLESGLAAAVAVEDDPLGDAASCAGGHAQRGGDEFGAHVVGHRVAQPAPRTEIEDRSQIQPALAGRDVGDVADPGDIGRPGVEAPPDEIRQRRGVFGRDRGPHPRRLVHAHDPVDAHQPLDPLVVHRPAPVSQLRSHARLAVGAVGLLVDLTDRRD